MINFTQEPFPHAIISGFSRNHKDLLTKLQQQEFELKRADLFEFSQTNELTQSPFSEFKDHLLTEIKPNLPQPLKNHCDVFGTLYQDTNYLLPHDDQLENRKYAYIFYLTTLDQKDGGQLQLLSDKGEIIISIQPQENHLIIFEVSPTSFHQVAEVITQAQRYALTGWFYA